MNRNTLLIVDDMEVNRAILRSLFEDDYNLLEAQNGDQALMMLNQYADTIAAMLLDIVMPVKDGYQVLEEMAQAKLLGSVPVIVITAQDSSENEVRAFDLGASDIVMKPFEAHVVRRRVQNVVELHQHRRHLEELVEEQAVGLRESRDVLMDALSSVIEHRSIESGQHVLRIRMFTRVLLEDVMHSYPEYGLTDRKIDVIASAAALHDIGKIAIPDVILNKPGPLTEEEFEVMKTHTEKGCEILAGLERMHDKEYLQYAYNICRYHHERWDGKGYPEGLKGENIPICAQAVGIADAYDALTTDRVYKQAYTPETAYNMILNGKCGRFSPRLMECFKNVQKAFADLTRNYADGLSPRASFKEAPPQPLKQVKELENTLELGQIKYFAMLRYENSTVMEVDAESGVYHLVYKESNDFDAFRSGTLFEASCSAFLQSSVHPDDREHLQISSYIQEFLVSGAMERSWKCRVFHRACGEYVWYEATMLRINTKTVKQHKILLVWRKLGRDLPAVGEKKSIPLPIMENSMIGIQQCRNDRWFTMLQINDGVVSLLGYSREDLQEMFQNRFIEIIHPEDREAVIQQIRKQLDNGNTFELEYRAFTKDGRVLWLLDKSQLFMGADGVEYLNCVLIDITKSKQEQEELRLTMERHQIIMDQTNDIIFEWDIRLNQIYYSPNWIKKFGYEAISKDISTRIPQASHILPEDIPVFVVLMNDVRTGAPYGEAELRIANAEGQYLWCRIRATTQFDHEGKPIKAVGVILDIDGEKRRTQDLIDKADRDNLTNLHNKNAARHRIQGLMKQQEDTKTSAMMVIDLDNFKVVNDSFGHMFGDAVLLEASARLQKLFRPEDVVSRIGGDEFLVYINNIPNKSFLLDRAEKLTASMQGVLAEELHEYPLSCSVGVACFPNDASDYQELFLCCDKALYKAKSKGKNQFILYDNATMGHPFGLEPQQMAIASTRIESNEAYDFETANMVQQVFRVLSQSGHVEKAVRSILEMVGRKYHVSRAYIFEESEDGSYCTNTFEWCDDGIEPEIDQLQSVAYAEIGDYHENFDANGIFYCTDTSVLPKEQYELLASQGVRSLLQCAIHDTGKFAGFVGFDDCTNKRVWTQSQINALTFVSELLSIFLLKKRAQDRVEKAAADLRTLLNAQNSWIYVIDPDTYALQYINAKTSRIAPNSKVGVRCYEAFFNRKAPCEICPAHNIRKSGSKTMEIHNPVLHVWSSAHASLIPWDGKEACLLVCHDITPYKTNEGKREEGKSI